jgi:putative DNA primase/helicase
MSLDQLDEAIKRMGGPGAVVDAALPKPRPTVTLTRGDDVKLEPVHWAWNGFLPLGMLTVMGGAPGCGKTTIALSLAAIITKGGLWPDGTRCAEAGDVLVWSGEDGESVLAARLCAEGADMTKVHFISGMANGDAFDPGTDMAALESAALELPRLRLLIVDPIVSAVVGDGNKAVDVRRSLQPIVDLAKRSGCAVIGITHFSKGTAGRDPLERVTGSQAFGALARVVLVASKAKPDDEGKPRRVLMRAKSNIGADDGGHAYELERVPVAPGVEGQRVTWGVAIEGSALEVLDEAEEKQGADSVSVTNDADEALRRCIGRDLVPSAEVREAMRKDGFTDKQVKRPGI